MLPNWSKPNIKNIIKSVDDVEYISFEDASELVKTKYKEYYKILDQEFVSVKDFKLSPRLNEAMIKPVINSNFGCLLKDQAYTHEKEVRAFFTACLRNNVSREKLTELNKKDDTSAVFGTATCYYPPSSELPNIIKIPTSKAFIESICFDPRMPRYKIEAFMDIFSDYLGEIDIEESHAFGYKPEKYDFTIRS